MAELIFVYGKLRRGLEFHMAYLSGSEYKGTFVLQGFKMYQNPEDRYPFIIRSEGSIVGELFTASHEQLANIDNFQKVPAEFTREKIAVGENQAWVYLYAQEKRNSAVEVPGGDWSAYESNLGN